MTFTTTTKITFPVQLSFDLQPEQLKWYPSDDTEPVEDLTPLQSVYLNIESDYKEFAFNVAEQCQEAIKAEVLKQHPELLETSD